MTTADYALNFVRYWTLIEFRLAIVLYLLRVFSFAQLRLSHNKIFMFIDVAIGS